MSPLLHIVLTILLRTVSAMVGVYAFIVVFLYKKGRDTWQNRLDAVWVEIDDRAKDTDSVFTALVNRVALWWKKLLDDVFGTKTISLQLVSTSVFLAYLSAATTADILHHDRVFDVGIFALLVICVVLMLVKTRVVYVSALGIATCVALFALGVSGFLLYGALWHLGPPDNHGISIYAACTLASAQVAVIMSVISDTVSVIVLRKLCSKLAETPSIRGVVRGSLALICLACVVSPLPRLLSRLIVPHRSLLKDSLGLVPKDFVPHMARYIAANFLSEISAFNLITVIYILVPCITLVSLVLHKTLWPLLPRFTYPLFEEEILSKRKYLVPIGLTAFALAFGYTTLSDLLKKWLTH